MMNERDAVRLFRRSMKGENRIRGLGRMTSADDIDTVREREGESVSD